MSSEEDRIQFARQQRAATLEQLRRSEPDLVRVLEIWDAVLAGVDSAEPQEHRLAQAASPEAAPYARYDSAADALAAYIRNHGPTPRLTAMKAVVSGGWASDRPDAMGLMRDAMNYQLNRSRSPKIVVRKGDILDIPE